MGNAKYQKDRREKAGEEGREKERLRGCRRRTMAQNERKKAIVREQTRKRVQALRERRKLCTPNEHSLIIPPPYGSKSAESKAVQRYVSYFSNDELEKGNMSIF
jgi:hypothetical protein